MIKVAIIILIYNGGKYLPALFKSLNDYKTEQYQVKIIIVDNASTDHAVDFIKNNYPETEIIINEKNLGFAEGNNRGINWALTNGYDYLVLLNQDIRVSENWLEPLINALAKQDNLGAVQPKIMYWPETDKINSLGNILHYLGFGFTSFNGQKELAIKKYPQFINYASGAAVAFPTKVLRKTGLFDEEYFMYHEDTDLSLRIKFFGYQIKLIPEAKVFHQYEFSRSLKKFYYIERNRLMLLLKFYKLPTLFLILPPLIFLEVGLIIQSLFNGFFIYRLKVYGYFINPLNIKKIIKKRKKIQKERIINDLTLFKELAGKIEFQEIDNLFLKYIFNPILNFYKFIIERIIFW